jgi:vacuolar-type H+-ATPase catalytic subunit A/Vma1
MIWLTLEECNPARHQWQYGNNFTAVKNKLNGATHFYVINISQYFRIYIKDIQEYYEKRI